MSNNISKRRPFPYHHRTEPIYTPSSIPRLISILDENPVAGNWITQQKIEAKTDWTLNTYGTNQQQDYSSGSYFIILTIVLDGFFIIPVINECSDLWGGRDVFYWSDCPVVDCISGCIRPILYILFPHYHPT